MLFSIIIPAYNAEKYLDDCLSSVALQSCRDFEVIAVDDGSSDRTGETLDSFALSNRNVIVLHGQNKGLLLARRKGLKHASGEYIVFLDSDDCLRRDCLAVLSAAIDESHADIISFQFCRDEGFAKAAGKSSVLNGGIYSGAEYARIKEHVCRGRFNNLCGKAIRRDCIDIKSDYSEFQGLMHGEDLFQFLPIIDRCSSLCQLENILYYYRPNDSASTASYKTRQLTDIVLVNRRLRDYAAHWSGNCPHQAVIGETSQYFNLVKLNELSNTSSSEKVSNFLAIAQAMSTEGAYERAATVKLRFDNEVLLFALEHGLTALAAAVVRIVEWVKKW